MNRRQLSVLWVGTLVLSATCGLYGWNEKDLFFAVVLPVFLIGALLVFQWRDQTPLPGPGANGHASLAAGLLLAVVILQGLALADQHRQLRAIHEDVNAIAGSLEDLLDSEESVEETRALQAAEAGARGVATKLHQASRGRSADRRRVGVRRASTVKSRQP